MIYLLPVVGWAIGFVFSFFLAIPFTILWNWLAPHYMYWLPEVYLHLPFWHCVGLLMLVPMVKLVLTPKFMSVTSSSK